MPKEDSAVDVAQLAPTRNPVAGRNMLYPKADDKWYTKDSAGTETLVGPAAADTATTVAFTPTGGIAANTVQAAIAEVDSEKATDTLVVHKAGAETITGDKTFSTPLIVAEQGSSPATPASGFAKIYPKSDGYPYWKGDDGIERALITPAVAVHTNPGFEGTYVAGSNYNSTPVGMWPPGWGAYWTDDGCTASEVAALTEGAKAVKLTKIAGERQARVHSATEFVVKPFDTVTFEVDVQGSGTVGTGTAHLTLQTAPTAGQADFFGTGLQQQTVTLSYDTTVKRLKATFTVPSGHIAARFTLNSAVTGDAAGAITWDNSASSVTTPAAGTDTLEWIALGLSAPFPVTSTGQVTVPFTLKHAGVGLTVNGSGQIVVATPGVYHVECNMTNESGGGYQNLVLKQWRGGANIRYVDSAESADSGLSPNTYNSQSVSSVFDCLAGDVFEVQIACSAPTITFTNYQNRQQFNMHKLAGPGPQGDIGPTGPTGYTDLTVRVVAVGSFNPLSAAPSTADGTALLVGDRVLKVPVTGGNNAGDSGIYTVTTVGTGANGVWARSTDADTAAELYAADVKVGQGTTYGGTRWSTSLKSTQSVGTNVFWFCYAGDTGWINISFASGWSNYGATWDTGQYRRLNGVVYLKGLVKGGTGTIFTLPAGFRPAGDQHVATLGNGLFAIINIFTNGIVALNTGGAGSFLSLQVPPFPADN